MSHEYSDDIVSQVRRKVIADILIENIFVSSRFLLAVLAKIFNIVPTLLQKQRPLYIKVTQTNLNLFMVEQTYCNTETKIYYQLLIGNKSCS